MAGRLRTPSSRLRLLRLSAVSEFATVNTLSVHATGLRECAGHCKLVTQTPAPLRRERAPAPNNAFYHLRSPPDKSGNTFWTALLGSCPVPPSRYSAARPDRSGSRGTRTLEGGQTQPPFGNQDRRDEGNLGKLFKRSEVQGRSHRKI